MLGAVHHVFYEGSLGPPFFLGAILFSAGNALLLIMREELWLTLATGRVGRYLYVSYAFAFMLYCGELCIAESTTKHHISSIYRKIGVCDRQDLMDALHRGIAGKGAV